MKIYRVVQKIILNNNNYENFNNNEELNQTINETVTDKNSTVSYKEIYLIKMFKL